MRAMPNADLWSLLAADTRNSAGSSGVSGTASVGDVWAVTGAHDRPTAGACTSATTVVV